MRYEWWKNMVDEKKLGILKELFVHEEHTLEDLRRLVNLSKPFLKIESKTGEIFVSREFPLRVPERAILYLIGIYFSREAGLNKDIQITSGVISENIDTIQTTLSGPLGDLINKRIIFKDKESYLIKYYEIEKQLDFLTNKYLVNKEFTNSIQPKQKKIAKKSIIKKSKTRKIVSKDEKIKQQLPEDVVEEDLKKFDLSIDQLNTIFNQDKNNIILLRGFKCTNYREEHLKSSLLLLTANKLFCGQSEIDSSLFRENLNLSGVHLRNISTTLKNFSTDIIHKRGPIGSTNTKYQLTSLGLQNGIILIKDIINNTSNFSPQFKRQLRVEKASPIKIEQNKLLENIQSFAKHNEIDENKLRTYFDFQPDNLRILIGLKEKVRKTAQIKTLMLLGVLLKEVYQINNFDGKTLLMISRINCDRLDLLDSNKYYNKYFSKKSKAAMQLTYSGEIHAIKMIKEYVKKQDCEL
ncbi:MAG: hypothetical protein KJ771_02500 [Nanoarchaeota archaeon]|nr:hypothetical protein [Nanoarchaeota archaeon]